MNVVVLRYLSSGSSDSGYSSPSGESLDEFHYYILEGGNILGYQFEPSRVANSINDESAETEADQNMLTDEEESSVCLGNLYW